MEKVNMTLGEKIEKELNEKLEKAYEDMLKGRTRNAKDVFSEIHKNKKL